MFTITTVQTAYFPVVCITLPKTSPRGIIFKNFLKIIITRTVIFKNYSNPRQPGPMCVNKISMHWAEAWASFERTLRSQVSWPPFCASWPRVAVSHNPIPFINMEWHFSLILTYGMAPLWSLIPFSPCLVPETVEQHLSRESGSEPRGDHKLVPLLQSLKSSEHLHFNSISIAYYV